MQRAAFTLHGLKGEKVLHPDGSVTITVRGCGNTACADENCALHDGVITVDVDAYGKRTCNVPDHLRPLLHTCEAMHQEDAKKRQQEEEAKKRLRLELEKKLALVNKEIEAVDAFLTVLHNLSYSPVWEEEKTFVGQHKEEKVAERTKILQQIQSLDALHK